MAGDYRYCYFLDVVFGMVGSRHSVSGVLLRTVVLHADNFVYNNTNNCHFHKDRTWRPFVGMARRKTEKIAIMV